jgi:apolipoprotein N-acyltransferase
VVTVTGSTATDSTPMLRRGRRDTTPSRRWRGASALLFGLVAAAAFAPLGWAPLSVVAVAGLAVICRDVSTRTGARLGFTFGLAFFLPLLHWSSTFVGAPPWLLLSLSQAAFGALLGAGLAAVSWLRFWPIWTACVWVTEELLRDRLPFGGFPWGRLGFSQAGTPFARYASIAGAPLVTSSVALCGGLLAAALTTGLTAGWRRAVTLAALAVLIPAAGLAIPVPTAGERGSGPPTVRVAVVQGGKPREGLNAAAQDRGVLQRHVAETVRLAGQVAAGRVPRPDLVVWPENASDLDPYRDGDARALIDNAVRTIGVPVLVGAVLDAGPRHLRNSGIVWNPVTGPGAVYDKRHPVPFAEYIPLRPLARLVSRKVNLVPRDFLAGHRPGVLQVGPARLGDVICFEVAADGLVRDAVRGGGRLLVVQTNNATFGRSAETEQQLAMSRMRAIEHGRTVLIAATTGVSAIISPNGAVTARSALYTPTTLVGTVSLRDSVTVADRLGAGPEWVLAGIGLIAAALGAGRPTALRRRRGFNG